MIQILYTLSRANSYVGQVWENGHEGVDGGTFSESIHNRRHFSAGTIFGLTFFDIFLYAFLTWYFDKVRIRPTLSDSALK